MEESTRAGRVPPHSDEAERGVLGSLLMDAQRVMPLALNSFGVTQDYFYVPAHRNLFNVLVTMTSGSAWAIDLLTVSQFVRDRAMEGEIGGTDYLDTLIGGTPTDAHAEHYLAILRDKYLRRQTIETARELVEEAYGNPEPADALVLRAPQRFAEVLKHVEKEKTNEHVLNESVHEWSEARRRREAGEVGVITGLPTPYPKLNELLGGLLPGLIIVSGRPSQGKTTLEGHIMVELASAGVPVGRITMDMTKKRLLQRALMMKAGVSLAKMRMGFGTGANFESVNQWKPIVSQYPMYFLEQRTDLRVICSWARSMVARHGIKALSIDYVQQIMTNTGRMDENENMRITHVSGRLKALALELNIPVFAVSQMSRQSETTDREPKLSDLRGSGSLEQDAQVAIFVYQDKEVPRVNNQRPTWIDVQKQQDGEIGRIPMWLREKYFMFEQAPVGFGVENEEEKKEPKNHKGSHGRRSYDDDKAPDWAKQSHELIPVEDGD